MIYSFKKLKVVKGKLKSNDEVIKEFQSIYDREYIIYGESYIIPSNAV